jgi:hypothetical protein
MGVVMAAALRLHYDTPGRAKIKGGNRKLAHLIYSDTCKMAQIMNKNGVNKPLPPQLRFLHHANMSTRTTLWIG